MRCTVWLFIGYFDTFAYDSALFPFSLDISFVVLVRYLTRFIAFCPLLSPATLLRRSRCAHSLGLSRSPPPLKHLHNHDWRKDRGRVAYPQNNFPSPISSTWIGKGAYNATDSRDCRLRSEFFYRYIVCFFSFSDKYFLGL